MDKDTKYIFSKIAFIQLEALSSIKKDPESSDEVLCNLFIKPPHHSCEPEIFNATLQAHIDLYTQMLEMPSIVRMLSEYQLLVCSHILFRMEDTWITEHSEGVYGAWYMIHACMMKYHPEFNLIPV